MLGLHVTKEELEDFEMDFIEHKNFTVEPQ
jgi:hypothetical protein